MQLRTRRRSGFLESGNQMRVPRNFRINHLIGEGVCTGFLVEQSWLHGRLHDQYHSFLLRVGGDPWRRFRVNGYGLSWEVVATLDRAPTLAGCRLCLVDVAEELGVLGLEIERMEYREEFGRVWDGDGQPLSEDAEFTVWFWGGRGLIVHYYGDNTTVRVVAGSEDHRTAMEL